MVHYNLIYAENILFAVAHYNIITFIKIASLCTCIPVSHLSPHPCLQVKQPDITQNFAT